MKEVVWNELASKQCMCSFSACAFLADELFSECAPILLNSIADLQITIADSIELMCSQFIYANLTAPPTLLSQLFSNTDQISTAFFLCLWHSLHHSLVRPYEDATVCLITLTPCLPQRTG